MAQTCYRHPNRETGVSCSNCGRPICPDCMTPTPVGMRCPECARQRTKVTRGVGGAQSALLSSAPATFVLIALNAAVFLAEIASASGGFYTIAGSSLVFDYGLYGPLVGEGEWYRLLTSGFLHAGLLHVGFNMFALFFLGRILEPSIGTPRFLAVYFASLFGGAFGALLLSPDALTIGASGAIFGIFGATFVIARGRGFDAVASSIGVVLLINLALSVGASHISLGGHLGGLAAGLICGGAIVLGDRGGLGKNRLAAELAVAIGVAIAAILGALAIA
ncbi:MAG TPA: rhomboid family intramembrane serine protease [Solirubrobacterales bacterium]|nr:rhomboid family intramembrane serine protease [Solirubrobacterales bacterium]